MTRHLRTTAICAGLLVLFSRAAWGQPYPVTSSHGFTGYRLASVDSAFATLNTWPPAETHLAMNRLPVTSPAKPLAYMASTNLGRPHAYSTQASPLAEQDDACGKCRQYECACGPRWIFSADVLWMSRSRVDSQTMIETPLGGVVTSESFNADELMFEARAGFQTSWGYDLLDGRALEFTAMSVYDQPAAADVADSDMYFSFHGASPAIATDAYTINYVSNLHSGELNWWLDEVWGIRPMIGARWLRVREEFSIDDTTTTSWDAFSQMRNDLVGAQIGFKTCIWNGGDWFRVETAMKSGIYNNDVKYHAYVRDSAGVLQGSMTRRPSATSFAGELTVSAVVQLCPRLSMRCGYRGLWMSRLALAPNQADQSDLLTGVGGDDFSALNYQGGFFGLEGNW